jgi:hypothetical protein
MKVSPHNKHIKKLIEQGFSDVEIRNEIKKMFGIQFGLPQINDKRKSELNDLIKPFRQDAVELLYPILYKGFPDRNFIKERLEQIINYLIDAIKTVEGFPSEDVLIDLLLAFEEGLNTYKHDAFLYRLIYQYKTKGKQELEDSRAIQQLKVQIEDPFKYYFSLSNMNMEHMSFREDSPEFDHIIREVCRDNVITKNERVYLEEKAAEYFIDPDKLKLYLDNPFLGYETFKMFIDQICEDGVVTDTERQYINEKAEQYNVPFHILEKMISSGILRSQFAEELSQDDDFYEIVLIYLFANTFKLKPVAQMLSVLFNEAQGSILQTDEIVLKKEAFFKLFCDTIMEDNELMRLKTKDVQDIYNFYDILNLYPKNLNQFNQKVNLLEASKTGVDEININGYFYKIEWINVKNKPLFFEEYKNSTYSITLNENHWFFENKGVSEKNIIEKMILSLVSTKSDFYGSELDSFFNKLQGNIDLLKFEYN